MYLSRLKNGVPKHTSTALNAQEFRYTKDPRRGRGNIMRGTTTGIFSHRFFERTEAKLVFQNRLLFLKNFERRNLWKIEDAHFNFNRNYYSKRQQKFSIKEKNVQRYEFLPSAFVFPIHPEPSDHKKFDNELWLNYKRDPTVRNSHPKNYAKFICSEELNEYEIVEYLRSIYGLEGILSIELEKVQEQNLKGRKVGASPWRNTLRDVKHVNEHEEELYYNDRLKIAHIFLDQEFVFPDALQVMDKKIDQRRSEQLLELFRSEISKSVDPETGRLSQADWKYVDKTYGDLLRSLNQDYLKVEEKKVRNEVNAVSYILSKTAARQADKKNDLVRFVAEMDREHQMVENYQKMRQMSDFEFFCVLWAELLINLRKQMTAKFDSEQKTEAADWASPLWLKKFRPERKIRDNSSIDKGVALAKHHIVGTVGALFQNEQAKKEVEMMRENSNWEDRMDLLFHEEKIEQKDESEEDGKGHNQQETELIKLRKFRDFKKIRLTVFDTYEEAIKPGLDKFVKDPDNFDQKAFIKSVKEAAGKEEVSPDFITAWNKSKNSKYDDEENEKQTDEVKEERKELSEAIRAEDAFLNDFKKCGGDINKFKQLPQYKHKIPGKNHENPMFRGEPRFQLKRK